MFGKSRRGGRKWKFGCAAFVIAIALFAWLGQPLILGRVAGASSHEPDELETGLSAEARAVLERCYEGIDPARLLDVHTHVAGLGTDGSGCRVNPEMLSWLHPIKHAQFLCYAHAARITDLEHGDAQFVARLESLVRANPRHGRHGLLAFDEHYTLDGTAVPEQSEMYVPNDYVLGIAARAPDLFVPVISVHPYRADAVAELDRCAQRGARLCKWLPNAMGIDPADARCDPFYAALVRNKIALLTHTGEERAVDAAGAQDLGNPLRLRRALEQGVTVILAHCASLGDGEDLDAALESGGDRARVPNFDLFVRLMEEERWVGRLFGEISAVTLANRDVTVVQQLLARRDLHTRLVNGSDYPLPAIRVVWSAQKFANAGMLTDDEARALEELYDYNPLVFDFALKRTLRHPATGTQFAPEVFMGRSELGF